MIKPDYSKENYVPAGIKVKETYRKDLLAEDKVIVLGETFIVQSNEWTGERGQIKMKHETDTDTLINERYVHYEGKGMFKKIIEQGL